MPPRLIWAGLIAGLGLQLAGCNGSPTFIAAGTVEATALVQTAAVVVGGHSQTVSVTFVAAAGGGTPISDLVVGGLSSLPAGWHGPTSFNCGTVTTGSGCVLNLTYAPTVGGSGTLDLGYSFASSGMVTNATVAIPYSATSNDNVIASASPTGQITAVISDGSVPVTVNFVTDDGQTATHLSLTSALGSLPAGWKSSASSFSCATVSTGHACQLSLSYAPGAVGSGTLTLDFSYTDNAGETKTGSTNIPYAATTDDNIVYSVSPSGQVNATPNGTGTVVTVTFTTDDGQPATELSVTSGLTNISGDWSAPASFACATVSSGTACQLSLTYAPTRIDGGTLSLGYSYKNDAGNAKTGTVSISYAVIAPYLYVTNFGYPWDIDVCTLAANGGLSACVTTAAGIGLNEPGGIAFDGNKVYIADYNANAVYLCAVNADGTFSGCATAATGLPGPWTLAINGNYLYITGSNGGSTEYCQIGAGGALSNCAATASGPLATYGVATYGGYAYLSALNPGWEIDVCTINSDGTLTGCTSTGSGFSVPQFITVSGGYVYVANQASDSVAVCSIGTGGALVNCINSPIPSGAIPSGVAFYGGYAYVDGDGDNVYQCSIGSAGALTNCAISNGGATFSEPQQLAFH
jgi:hypothetical protein